MPQPESSKARSLSPTAFNPPTEKKSQHEQSTNQIRSDSTELDNLNHTPTLNLEIV